jgi:hypothetical protein
MSSHVISATPGRYLDPLVGGNGHSGRGGGLDLNGILRGSRVGGIASCAPSAAWVMSSPTNNSNAAATSGSRSASDTCCFYTPVQCMALCFQVGSR